VSERGERIKSIVARIKTKMMNDGESEREKRMLKTTTRTTATKKEHKKERSGTHYTQKSKV
jgi:hypothetical protein